MDITNVRVNFDGDEDLMELFALYDIYDSTRYDYSYKEIAKAFKKVFKNKDIEQVDISDKDTLIVITKLGYIEFVPMNKGFESIANFELYLKGEISKLMESKKSSRKSMKESKDRYVIWSNEGYLDFEGDPSENISDDEYYLIFDDKKDAEEYIKDLQKKYDNKWSDSLEVQKMWESKKSVRKSMKESNYDLINDDLLAILKGSCKQLTYTISDYQGSYSDRSLKELQRKLEEVEDLCNKVLYQVNKRK